MFTMTCNCGKTSMTFKHLGPKDFANGWESECCDVVEKSETVESVQEMKSSVEVDEAPSNPPEKKKNKKK